MSETKTGDQKGGGPDPAAAGSGGSAPELSSARSPTYHEVIEWVGHRVDDVAGNSVAKVEGMFVDQESGEPAWLIAKLGRFGKTVAIPIRECAAAAGRVWVPQEREVIRDAPAIDASLPLKKEQEQAILSHYEIPPDVGRGIDLAGRPDGAFTSQAPAEPEE